MFDAIQTELISLIMTVIVALFGFITTKVTSFLNEKGVVAKIEKNKQLVKIVVDAIEQSYKELNGEQKLAIAKKEIVELMNEKKIKISEKEIDLLIEAMVKEMNSSIKKELNK